VLSLLACDPDPLVRSKVATKNKLTDELFALLSADQDASVRARIAHNKNTREEILRRLALDVSEIVSTAARAKLGKRQ